MIDAHLVGNNLWVGRRPYDSLRHSFDVVVFCAIEHQDIDTDIEALYLPFKDAEGAITQPILETLVTMAWHISKLRKEGKRVLVTCAEGVNRSALLAALSLMLLDDLSAKQAIKALREKRKPPCGMTPLCNKSFEAFLHGIDKNRLLRKDRKRK